MEKIFTPNRWFVLFCALLIVVFGTLRVVQDMHLAEIASMYGKDVFDWTWPEKGLSSKVIQMQSKVLRRDANDAVVEVTGHQIVAISGEKNTIVEQPTFDVKAVLTFYRRNSEWELGKVELK